MTSRFGGPFNRLSPFTIIFGLLFLLSIAFTFHNAASPVQSQVPAALVARVVDRFDVASIQDVSARSFANHSLVRREDFSCDIGRPCHNGACCGVSGFCGYGPTYCGDGCSSNCDAFAECGQYSVPAGAECPLKVCCSEFGFCGTTDDFCGNGCQSGCGHPSPPSGGSSIDVKKRVVGYYEAWGARRQCHQMSPSSIPVDGLTHVNFAFAYIEPGTYKITTMDSQTPAELFKEVADVRSTKSGNGDLEVFVAVGGWTFSDNDTVTQPLFGEIAADAGKRQTFADNVVLFMKLYGFDGLDIDWEYPGAPDRGGKVEDTANFVLLVKTLRETFDKTGRKYGLTFTIPTSYWYLKWFDLPAMEPYVDWINMMSYDLHGFWDRLNPIGAIIHGHTNLTEIKLAAELLWRVGVSPGKVVLGTGFYGRSFTLTDTACATPGCSFGGLSNKGPCTGEGGILGYFEIQDILGSGGDTGGLSRRSSTPIHDVEAAVKYVQYDTNQWVSYDDKDTFKQKVDWANSVGLGGLMIWAVDIDDKKFSALSGLLGLDFGTFNHQTPGKVSPDGSSVSQSWSNGKGCFISKCWFDSEADGDQSCGVNAGFLRVGQRQCGKGKKESICCPTTAAPSSCQWRGGETGGLCNGQCHGGEINLLSVRGSDGDGSHHHCTSGWQIFCCKADRWAAMIDQCKYAQCGGECPTNYEEVTKVYTATDCDQGDDGGGSPVSPPTNGFRKFCCPKPKQFTNCHWIGKGDCADNTCTNSDGKDDGSVELMTDRYGDGTGTCRYGRSKVCCCNPPAEQPFVPVKLEYLFETVPDASNTVKYDLQFPDGGNMNNPDSSAIGFILIDGDPQAVSVVNKRDGSHLEFLDCEMITGEHRQTIRYICTNDGPDSNCDDMLLGGIAGTVLRMPNNCGPGAYVVGHETRTSTNQTLPFEFSYYNFTVMELVFDYNFNLVRRDSGSISLRIDYSNIPGYWDAIVDTPGALRKRSIEDRGFGRLDWWAAKFQSLRDKNVWGTMNSRINQRVLAVTKSCTAANDAYLDIAASGQFGLRYRFGFTFTGTIVPFSSSEVTSFFDAQTDLNYNLDISAYGAIKDSSKTEAALYRTAITKSGLSHPGIVHMQPWLNAELMITADIELDGNFSVAYDHQMNLEQTVPQSMKSQVGNAQLHFVDNGLRGRIKAATDGGLKINTFQEAGLEIVFNKFGNTGELLGINITAGTDTYAAIEVKDKKFSVSVGSDSAAHSVLYASGSTESFAQWAGEPQQSIPIGDKPAAISVAAGAPGDDGDPEKPGPSAHQIDFDGTAILARLKDALNCPKNLAKTMNCSVPTCYTSGSYLLTCENDDDGIPSADRGHPSTAVRRHVQGLHAPRSGRSVNMLEPRDDVPRRFTYTITLPSGETSRRTISWRDEPYPSVGNWPDYGAEGDEQLDHALGINNWDDCVDTEIVERVLPAIAIPPPLGIDHFYHNEHGVELNTMPRFFGDIAAGELQSGDTPALTPINPRFFAEAFQLQNWLTNVGPVRGGENSGTYIVRIAIALGSVNNRAPFVVLEADMNNMKQMIWLLKQLIDATKLENWLDSDDHRGSDDPVVALVQPFRNIVGVFNYMNFPRARRWVQTANDIHAIHGEADAQWNAANPTETINLQAWWSLWFPDLLRTMTLHARAWAENALAEIEHEWGRLGDAHIDAGIADIRALVAELNTVTIDTTGLL